MPGGQQIAASQGVLALPGSRGQVIQSGQGFLTPRRLIQSAQGNVGVNIRPTNITSQFIAVARGNVVPAGAPVVVNLSGVEADFTQGIVIVGPVLQSADVAGSSLTASAGSMTTSRERALLGSAATAARGIVSVVQIADDTFIASGEGSVTQSSAALLVGLVVTGSQGAVITVDEEYPLTGIELVASQGLLEASYARVVSGQQLQAEQGAVGAPLEKELSGQEAVATAGEITALGVEVTLAGQAISGLHQTLALRPVNTTSALNGAESVAEQYPFGAPVTRDLTGAAAAFAHGTLVYAQGAEEAMVGHGAVGAQGDVTHERTNAIAGEPVAVAQGYVGGVPESVDLVGQSASVGQGNLVAPMELTGQASQFAAGFISPTNALAGLAVTVAQGVVGKGDRNLELVGQELIAGQYFLADSRFGLITATDDIADILFPDDEWLGSLTRADDPVTIETIEQ